MDLVVPYWHPVVVHFPIALLALGAVVALVYAGSGRAFWRGAALLLIAPGALGAWGATWTGETIEEAVEGEPVAEFYLEDHETYGEWARNLGLGAALGLFGLAVWAARTGRDRTTPDPIPVRLVIAGLGLGAGVFVLLAGRLGGLMVWGVPG